MINKATQSYTHKYCKKIILVLYAVTFHVRNSIFYFYLFPTLVQMWEQEGLQKCSLLLLHMDGTLLKCIHLRLPLGQRTLLVECLLCSWIPAEGGRGTHNLPPASLFCHVPGEECNGSRLAPWCNPSSTDLA